MTLKIHKADTSNGNNQMDFIIYGIVGGLVLCLLGIICVYLGCRFYNRIQSISPKIITDRNNQAVQSVSVPDVTSTVNTNNQINQDVVGIKVNQTNIVIDITNTRNNDNDSDDSDNDVIQGMNVTQGKDMYAEPHIDEENGQENEKSVHDSYYDRTHHLFQSSSSNHLEFGGETFEI